MQLINCNKNIIKNTNSSFSLVAKLRVTAVALLLLQLFILSDAFALGGSESGNTFPNCTGDGGNGGVPRMGCKDLVHLPLCSLGAFANGGIVTVGQPANIKPNDLTINCVKECSEFNDPDPSKIPSNERGVDYAVHNVHCIRFCPITGDGSNASESATGIVTISEGGQTVSWNKNSPKCIPRLCHQLPETINPIESGDNKNCDMLGCNLLTIEELKDQFSSGVTKFGSLFFESNQSKTPRKYCSANNNKCYNFSRQKLPYIMWHESDSELDSMCQIHECDKNPLVGGSCNSGNNDSLNITNKGVDYVNDYKKYIDDSFQNPDAKGLFCRELQCKPVVSRTYYCADSGDGTTSEPDPDCDSPCINGRCTKDIDCNLETNSAEEECQLPPEQSIEYEAIQTLKDRKINSSFYRPSPPLPPKFTKKVIQPGDTNPPTNTALTVTETNLCYNTAQMIANEPDEWGFTSRIGKKYFHPALLRKLLNGILNNSGTIRSPGLCNPDQKLIGNGRGKGAGYLCDNIYYPNSSDDDFDSGYISGRAKPYYYDLINNRVNTNKTGSTIVSCLRFRNYSHREVCGARECYIECAGSKCKTQFCGVDECRILTVPDGSDGVKCSSPLTATDDCSAQIAYGEFINTSEIRSGYGSPADRHIRMRSAKYPPIIDRDTGIVTPDRLCTFLDERSLNSFLKIDHWLSGTETLEDGTCMDQNAKNSSPNSPQNGSCVGGYNSNISGLSDLWRAVRLIEYVSKSYQPYVTVNGKVLLGREVKKQQCAYVPLKISPPRWYKIANERNSVNLFSPPLFISSVKISKFNNTDAIDGKTDFYYPSVEVTLGNPERGITADSRKIISLDAKDIGESSNRKKVLLKTMLGSKEYLATVYVTKEYDSARRTPMFCLYREQAIDNKVSSKKVSCVDRRSPEIDAMSTQVVDGSTVQKRRKLLVTAPTTNTYSNAGLDMQLMFAGDSANDTTCGDDKCLEKISFSNAEVKGFNKICKEVGEEYIACAKREPCSQLFTTCIDNEIELSSLLPGQEGYDSHISKKEFCDKDLLQNCNGKWGITDSAVKSISELAGTIDTSSGKPSIANDHAYGWFNEICITEGFESRLKNIVAYLSDNSFGRGKCVINPDISGSNCESGGNASRGCYCLDAQFATTQDLVSDGLEVRKQTPREAGLCVDIPYPKVCPAINFGDSIKNLNGSDISIDKTIYDNTIGVHESHRNRTIGKRITDANGSNPIVVNAEFNSTFSGISSFAGSCNGFWKSADPLKRPTLDCRVDGTWGNLKNPCIRYSCESKTTQGIVKDPNTGSINGVGIYTGDYSVGENLTELGKFNGFANWINDPVKNASNNPANGGDFSQNIVAKSCIVGFKPIGSTLNYSGDKFTSISGGTLPTRSCNQKGDWRAVSNECQRIECKAPIVLNSQDDITLDIINIHTRSNILVKNIITKQEYLDINQNWGKFGGAIFTQNALASRSNQEILGAKDELLTITGECYNGAKEGNNIIFYQQSGENTKPTLSCDHFGNWVNLTNPCVTTCDAVGVGEEEESSGFARWAKVNVTSETKADGIFLGCMDGYVPNPYPSKEDPDYTGDPKRECSQNGSANVWKKATNACVNKCPSEKVSARTSQGTVEITWPATDFNTNKFYAFDGVNGTFNEASLNIDASNFAENRTNKKYLLKRHCGSNGQWENVIPSCSTETGQIGNAIYSANTTNIAEYLEVGTQNTVEGSCIINHEKDGTTNPFRACSYKVDQNGNEVNKNVDEIFLKLTSGSKDCKQKECETVNGGLAVTSSNIDYYGTVTQTWKKDDVVTLQCGGGFGNTIGTSRVNVTPSAGNCFSTSSDRITTPPTAVCQADGTFGAITNPCSPCRSCNSSSVVESQTIPRTIDCGGVCQNSTATATSQEMVQSSFSSSINGFKTTISANKRICTEVAKVCANYNILVSITAQALCRDNYLEIISP